MIDKELSQNASGYFDETAYKAFREIMKGKKMDIYSGDIFRAKMQNGTNEKEYVVLAVHGKFCTVLMLSENESMPYMVNCQGIKYTDPGMLGYVFTDRFTDYIRSMSKPEFDTLLKAVVDSLGYTEDDVPKLPEPVISAVPESVKPEIIDTDAVIELAKAQAERDVYKNLYENLISSMVGRK